MKTVRATTKSVKSQGMTTATTAMQQMIFLLETVLQVVLRTITAPAILKYVLMSTSVNVLQTLIALPLSIVMMVYVSLDAMQIRIVL